MEKQRRRMLFEDRKIWLYVIKYILVAIGLLVFVLLVDMRVVPLADYLPDFMVTSVDLAKSILSTLAGALLTITTFTFSTTMVVLTTYASQFSPRVVENFLQEKTTMQVLGVFVGGFVYCITALFFMRNAFSDHKIISAGVAILYSMLCVIAFVRFIFSVANSIQAQKLISGLSQEAERTVDKFVTDRRDTKRADTFDSDGFESRYEIRSERNGFYELTDFDMIQKALEGRKFLLVIYPRIGDYIYKNQEIATLYHEGGALAEEDKSIHEAISLEEKRFVANDYRFAIQKIVEIALRAISPGINDPNTAIHCIQVLGVLTGKLGGVDGRYAITELDEGRSQVVDRDFVFRDDIYHTFNQILHYGKEDISIVTALLEALRSVALVSTQTNKGYVLEIGEYVYECSIGCYAQKLDIETIEARYGLLKKVCVAANPVQ